jgi:hypothetical protein
MPEGTRWNQPEGGYFLWLDCRAAVAATRSSRAPAREDVVFIKGADFFFHGGGEESARSRSRSPRARDRRGHHPPRAARPRSGAVPPERRPMSGAPRRDRAVAGRTGSSSPVRFAFGIESFGVNAYAPRHGGGVIEDTTSSARRGPARGALLRRQGPRASSRSTARRSMRPAGTFVFVSDPRSVRVPSRPGTDTCPRGRGGAREAVQRLPWEAWLEAAPSSRRGARAGDRDLRARARRAPGQPERPLQPRLLRGARRPRRSDASRTSARPSRRDPRTREWAQTDSDLRLDRVGPAVSRGELGPRRRSAGGRGPRDQAWAGAGGSRADLAALNVGQGVFRG